MAMKPTDDTITDLRCPFCSTSLAITSESYDLGNILRWWEEGTVRFSTQVHQNFGKLGKTTLHQCGTCGFGKFLPTVVGTDGFYGDLASTAGAWYYMQEKWEYKRALDDIPSTSTVLDVGCGEGYFLQQLKGRGITAKGLELNSLAAATARSRTLDVEGTSIADYAQAFPHERDVVTMFQVLEHVVDPLAFLEAGVRCLKTNGTLIVSVPSAEGILKWAGPLVVNVPPHHVTRWTTASFAAAAAKLRLDIVTTIHEPFWHYGLLVNAWESGLKNVLPVKHQESILYVMAKYLGRQALRLPIRVLSTMAPKGLSAFPGHSLYVVMRKSA